MAKKALVTGATGFVGSGVARALVAEGFAVRVLARRHSPRTNLEGMAVEVAEGDLTDPSSLRRAAAGCTAVFHVAADYRLWTRDAAAMFRVNVEGSRAVVLAAMEAGAQRIVYTSSVATLGIPGGGASGDETTPVAFADMIGPYKQSKFKAEEEVRRLIAEENAPVVIVNPSTPIGPGDVKPTPTGRMIVEAASGRMPAFVDTGLNARGRKHGASRHPRRDRPLERPAPAEDPRSPRRGPAHRGAGRGLGPAVPGGGRAFRHRGRDQDGAQEDVLFERQGRARTRLCAQARVPGARGRRRLVPPARLLALKLVGAAPARYCPALG